MYADRYDLCFMLYTGPKELENPGALCDILVGASDLVASNRQSNRQDGGSTSIRNPLMVLNNTLATLLRFFRSGFSQTHKHCE